MKISSLLPGANGKGKAAAALLDRKPDKRADWQEMLQRVSRAGSGQLLPDGSIGDVDQETDAEICLTKGEILIACGQGEAAKRFLRAAPRLTTTRRQLAEMTSRAASKDADFTERVAHADRARDAGGWAEGERGYADALALYPAHSGYLVQYAHCLKEQQKFAEAEIHYRSALALGAASGDVEQHLDFVMARQGCRERAVGTAPTARQEAATLMDASPTREDVDLVFTLLTGQAPADAGEVVEILRTEKTVRDVFARVIRQPSFRAGNRDLLRLIADGTLQL
jgi:tetratricopeptide (TPR) repeat protein